MKQTNHTLIATAALAGILSGGLLTHAHAATSGKTSAAGISAGVFADDKEVHSCKGKNSCKGKGGCKTGDNGCAGKNSCKGKGGCATKK
jgi:hypothetical protein